MANLFQSTLKITFSSLALIALSTSLALGQTYKRQYLSFTLVDKEGKELTDAAIVTGKVKVYSLREANVATDPHLNYDRTKKLFSFSESAYSPGINLAFVSPTDTMYLAVYGRGGTGRLIRGINVQKGSYVLTSNEFSGNKELKVDNWKVYLEEGESSEEQDTSGQISILRTKQPISLVNHTH